MNSNGIITAPVSIDDVKTILGITSNDLAVLCSSPKINMWAKYKPVPLNKNFHSDEWDQANNFWKSDAVWWKGENFEDTSICGMKVGVADDLAGLMKLYDEDSNGWEPKLPGGGNSAPYRLSDFIGYNHYAKTPFGGKISGFAIYNSDKSAYKIQCIMSYANNTSKTEFQLTDLGILAESHFGCFVVDENGQEAGSIVASSTLKDAGFTAVNDSISTVVAKKSYKLIPYLVHLRYISIPFLSPIEITIPDKSKSTDPGTGGTGTDTKLSISARFISSTSISVTIGGPTTSDFVVTLKASGVAVSGHTFGEIKDGESESFEFSGLFDDKKIYTVAYGYKNTQGAISVITSGGSVITD